jgi:hypothetical protein
LTWGCTPINSGINLNLLPYKGQSAKPSLNGLKKNFSTAIAKRAVFSDKKLFDIDGVYNHQNCRVWAASRVEADKKGAVFKKQKFPERVMVWLAVSSNSHSRLIVFPSGTVDHSVYIAKALPEAKRFGTTIHGSDWTFIQDGATAHTHHLSQQWCSENLPAFIPKSLWPPNSPDLNPLDFCVWNELVQGIKWDKVTNKQTLIAQIRASCGRLCPDTLQHSCESWRTRVLRLLDNDGAYVS